MLVTVLEVHHTANASFYYSPTIYYEMVQYKIITAQEGYASLCASSTSFIIIYKKKTP